MKSSDTPASQWPLHCFTWSAYKILLSEIPKGYITLRPSQAPQVRADQSQHFLHTMCVLWRLVWPELQHCWLELLVAYLPVNAQEAPKEFTNASDIPCNQNGSFPYPILIFVYNLQAENLKLGILVFYL